MISDILVNSVSIECANIEDIEFDFSRSSEDIFFQSIVEMPTKLKFVGAAYSTIKTATANLCTKNTISIKEWCNGSQSVIYNGYFTRANCEFNDDDCIVFVEVETDNKYTCLTKAYEQEINILRGPLSVTTAYAKNLEFEFILSVVLSGGSTSPPTGYSQAGAISISGSIFGLVFGRVKEVTPCLAGNPQTPNTPAPGSSAWYLVSNNCATSNTSEYAREFVSGTDMPFFAPLATFSLNLDWFDTSRTVYVNSTTVVAAPPPAGMTNPLLIGSVYVSPTAAAASSGVASGVYTFYVEYAEVANPITSISNGRFLNNTIQFMLNEYGCGLTLETDFFTNFVNPVTSVSPSPTTTPILYQKSDVANPSASEDATIANISLKTLMTDLMNLFNVRCQVDEVNNKFIVEHWSTLNQLTGGLDLTNNPQAINRNKYEFGKVGIPKKEAFKLTVSSGDVDFDGLDISYSAECSNGKVRNIQLQSITTDFEFVFENEDQATEGLVLVALKSLKLNDNRAANGRITGVFKANANFGYGALLPDYFDHNRPLNQGVVNNATVTFSSTERLKKLDEIVINQCCFFTDADKTVTTDQGTALIEKATYKPSDKTLKLTLKLEI